MLFRILVNCDFFGEPGTHLQIPLATTANRSVNTTEPTHVTGNLFSQTIGTLSLSQ
jgi:hypothetical protein